MGKQWQTLFFGGPESLQIVTAAMKLEDACFLEEKLWPTYTAYKKQRHYFANKGLSSQIYGFFLEVMYGCESWIIKKAERRRIDVFELWC